MWILKNSSDWTLCQYLSTFLKVHNFPWNPPMHWWIFHSTKKGTHFLIMWKELTVNAQKFREIEILNDSLLNRLISRNFCKKVFFNFYTPQGFTKKNQYNQVCKWHAWRLNFNYLLNWKIKWNLSSWNSKTKGQFWGKF